MLLDPNAYGGLLVVALVICEGASWGTAPLFKRTDALGLEADPGVGNSVHLFALGMDGPRLGSPASFCASGPRWRFDLVLAGAGRRSLSGSCSWDAASCPFSKQMASRPEQVQERFDLIHEALQAFVRIPFLGGGLGSFRLAAGEVAHNSAMWFLADFGIVGLAVLLGFLGWFFARGWFAYRFAPEERTAARAGAPAGARGDARSGDGN